MKDWVEKLKTMLMSALIFSLSKIYGLTFPAGTVCRKSDDENSSQSPVLNKQCTSIRFRELLMLIADNSSRRPAAEGGQHRRHVGAGSRPLESRSHVAGIGKRQHVKHLCREIPGQRDVAFVITVESEEITCAVERKVIRVTKTVRNNFAAWEIRSETKQSSWHGIFDRWSWHRRIRSCHARKISGWFIN